MCRCVFEWLEERGFNLENLVVGLLSLHLWGLGLLIIFSSCNLSVAPPSFVEWPESLTRPRAGTARFACQAEGNPAPKISWLKNGRRIHSNGRIKMYNR